MEFQFQPNKAFFRLGKYSVVYVVFTLLLVKLAKPEAFNLSPYMIIGALLVFAIPILAMFIQYVINDWKTSFKFEKASEIVLYTKNCKSRTYSIDQIRSIVLFCTPGRSRKGGFSFLWQDDFFYYKFEFENGESFVVTSMLVNYRLINPANFKGLNYQRKIVFFPFL